MTLTVGFVGLGVMGEPICRNLATKSGLPVIGYDRVYGPLRRLEKVGVRRANSLAELAEQSAIIFLALPSGSHVGAVCEGEQGLLVAAGPKHTIVDLGTSPVEQTRQLAAQFGTRGARYANSPIARTRQAAQDGTLSVMIGADNATFEAIKPLLATFATDITHCGPVGAGQIVKILNNMVLVQTVVALGEALATARRAGLDGKLLFDTLAKGSADSFALRNHGVKAMLVDQFPERAFSTKYARKDISYALQLAKEVGLRLRGAETADEMLAETIDNGFSEMYWPVLYRVIAASEKAAS